MRLKAKITVLNDEKTEMTARLQKMKLRRRHNFFNSVLKICINCKMEYKDADNFNWSCRTHTSEWSGEMWWCCGKTSRSAPGCKFSKHVMLKDED